MQLFKKEELPAAVISKVQSVYGATFLDDAQYTLWFSGNNITKEIIEKTIFKIVNQALGSSANNMNESDLKTIDLAGTADSAETPEETASETPSLVDKGAEEANAQAVSDLVGNDDGDDQAEIGREIADELEDGSADGDDDEDVQEINSEIEDELASDDEDDEDDEDGEDDKDISESVETPSAGEKFVFLKITMK